LGRKATTTSQSDKIRMISRILAVGRGQRNLRGWVEFFRITSREKEIDDKPHDIHDHCFLSIAKAIRSVITLTLSFKHQMIKISTTANPHSIAVFLISARPRTVTLSKNGIGICKDLSLSRGFVQKENDTRKAANFLLQPY
jgi:hypothetical protein